MTGQSRRTCAWPGSPRPARRSGAQPTSRSAPSSLRPCRSSGTPWRASATCGCREVNA